MDIAHSVPTHVKSISFSFLTSQDIHRISVKQITNPELLDSLNQPNVGGLYDPALGPSSKHDICGTCRLTYFTCPGHFGHIELPAPVYHPLFMTNMLNILRSCCLFCHNLKMPRQLKIKYIAKLRLLEHGLLEAALGLDDVQPAIAFKENSGDIEDDVEESMEDFEKRVNLYVAVCLRKANGTKRDDYKDGLVYQLRKDLILDFVKTASTFKKCGSCSAHGYTFRKEGHTKIIEYDLVPGFKAAHKMANIVRPNVLKGAAPSYPSGTDRDNTDVNMASDSEVGSSEGEDAAEMEHRLPKAANGTVKTSHRRSERVIAPEEARAHLRRLFSNEKILCSLIYGRHGPHAPLSVDGLSFASADMFFMDVLAVPPTRFRPPAKLGEQLFEHPQNELLGNVLKASYRLRDLNSKLRDASMKDTMEQEGQLPGDRDRILAQLLGALVQLQVDVNSFIDSSKNPTIVRQGKLPPQGVKQGLEKKEGLFRKNMMGKRVNYAARSVISPDVNIETNEIGIPPIFARKLTFPEPVTFHNVHEMRQLVINGPKYPGASIVQFEDGSQQSLDKLTVEQRVAIANQLLTPMEGSRAVSSSNLLSTRTTSINKKVFRHLRDGDILLLNRQPTLHKPSMMAHKARVLKGEKTIRMHYANCNSYNADFDGDEMNIHFAQTQVGRAEAMFIANTDNQYLVPTSGNPLRGLIQDHVVAGVWLTNKSTFFTREEYQQILYGALRPEDDYSGGGRVITLPPAIWKPQPLWTGKQIISTIMKNITPDNAAGLNLESKCMILNSHWGPYSYKKTVRFKDGVTHTIRLDGENDVIFSDGCLVSGILDKSQYGAKAYGLVHSVYEIYGAEVAGRLLSILSRLFTKFLQHRAFTCRMDDLLLTPDADIARNEHLRKGQFYGHEAAVENFPALRDKTLTSEQRNAKLKVLLEEVLRDDTKMADLDTTVKKKMSGLTSAIASTSIPNGLHRRFPDNHMQTMVMSGAKGSAVNARQISCSLGQTELEGRRVPVMVSGKTLPSFKPLETAAIAGGYIASRFLTGIKPQEFYFHCMAGREGLIDTAVKTSRSGYLQRCLIKHLEGIRVHYDNTVRGSDSAVYQFLYGGDGLDVTKQMHLKHFDFVLKNSYSIVQRTNPKAISQRVNNEEAVSYMKKALKKPEKYAPTMSVYPPSRYLGSTSEGFARALDDYVTKNTGKTLRGKTEADDARVGRAVRYPMKSKTFRNLANAMYLKSLVEPGEAVGLLASQGVGEPSTQMTLNTFHFAGHGAANVTLGIPRLREIVMTASRKPKTPTMTLPISQGLSRDRIESFCKKASRLLLSEVVDCVTVTEQLITEHGSRQKLFSVKINLFPKVQCQKEYLVETEELMSALGREFPLVLRKELTSELKKLGENLKSQSANIGKGRIVRENDEGGRISGDQDVDDDEGTTRKKDDDEASEIGDGDRDSAKKLKQGKQQATYDDSSESDDGMKEDETRGMDEDTIEAAIQGDDSSDSDDELIGDGDWADTMTDIQSTFMERCQPWATKFNFERDGSKCTFNLKFTSDTPKLLLVGIIERACTKTVIRQIPDILRCREFIPEKKSEGPKFMTEGCNFTGLWEYCQDEGDLNLVESNHIYAVLCAYGVEYARATIIREISNVFDVYNIKVDVRHLTLIADYMTFDGGYRPFSRRGIATHSSPLLKASYETTAAFLSDATLHGDFDTLTSPSGSIVLGRPATSGTGMFGIVTPLQHHSDEMDV